MIDKEKEEQRAGRLKSWKMNRKERSLRNRFKKRKGGKEV